MPLNRGKIVQEQTAKIAPDTEATGFIKKTITGADVQPSFGKLTVSKPGPGVVQGGLYWQYFEEYNKVTPAANYVSVQRELYRKVKTGNGEELRLLQPGETFKIGDRVTYKGVVWTSKINANVTVPDGDVPYNRYWTDR